MTGAMKYVVQGDQDSGLAVHVAREDGYAACGERCHSPSLGDGWWHDHQGVPRRMVPIPHRGPVTCQRPGCKG